MPIFTPDNEPDFAGPYCQWPRCECEQPWEDCEAAFEKQRDDCREALNESFGR